MQIQSEPLGPLEIPEESVVTFPFGIPGFPALRKYCLLEVKQGSRFKLLQSVELPALAFVVTDPVSLDPDYPMDDVRRIYGELGLDPAQPLAIAAIVTVPGPPTRPTANLLAPLVMGLTSRVGVQVVLHDSPYQVRHEM